MSVTPSPTSSGPSAAIDPRAANRRGIQLMVGAMACFIVNDSLVKVASESMPAMQLIFVRGIMATLWIMAFARASGVTWTMRDLRHPWVATRAVIDALASVAYLVSLFHLPIANATAINMTAPLFLVALAVPLLGERVDARRWAAIVAGFGGVLLVIRPSADGFNAYALLCLLATLMHALRDLATRRIPAGIPSLAITQATAVTLAVLAGVLTVPQGWQPIGWRELGLLACASVFLAGGYQLIVRSVRSGDMSAVAPWRYTGLLFAVVLGWAVWGDVPDGPAWAGIGLLVAAGVYLIRRERRR